MDRVRPEPSAPAADFAIDIDAELETTFAKNEHRFVVLEDGLNIIDCIPIFSIISGKVRSLFGLAQVVWYLGKATINQVASYAVEDLREKAKFRAFADYEVELAEHGAVNFARGVLVMALFIIANVCAIAYLWHPDLRYTYQTED